MQLGMVGLGRMGAGMTDRRRGRGHDLKTYDPNVESTAGSLEELVRQLDKPRSVWMMVPAAIVDGVLADLAPGIEAAERTPGREGDPAQPEKGWLHCGPSGAGHFVKMVHNGIEYGIMQA